MLDDDRAHGAILVKGAFKPCEVARRELSIVTARHGGVENDQTWPSRRHQRVNRVINGGVSADADLRCDRPKDRSETLTIVMVAHHRHDGARQIFERGGEQFSEVGVLFVSTVIDKVATEHHRAETVSVSREATQRCAQAGRGVDTTLHGPTRFEDMRIAELGDDHSGTVVVVRAADRWSAPEIE